MMAADEIARTRYRELVEALRSETEGERGGWQSDVAKRLGITQGMVSKIMRGERDPGLATISKAATRLGIRWQYFTDRTLEDPHWRDFVGQGSDARTEDPPYWQDFLSEYDRVDELDPADLETMRQFAIRGRRGVRLRSWMDWAVLADWVLNRKPSKRFEESSD